MNEAFFRLPVEKRQRMIDAAYRVFSRNAYKKAPMSEIAEAGGISKALLFHYFKNKKELYLFLWENAVEQVRRVSREYHVTDTADFFEMMERSLLAKCSLMRSSPDLYRFSVNAYYEQEPEIQAEIQARFQAESEACEETLWRLVDGARLRDGIDARLLYQELVWACDGYLRQRFLSGELDDGQIREDVMRMMAQWKKAYLKG